MKPTEHIKNVHKQQRDEDIYIFYNPGENLLTATTQQQVSMEEHCVSHTVFGIYPRLYRLSQQKSTGLVTVCRIHSYAI